MLFLDQNKDISLVDSFDKLTSAYYLYELALLVQAARTFSSQIGNFQTSASRMIERITQLSVSRFYHRGILPLARQ